MKYMLWPDMNKCICNWRKKGCEISNLQGVPKLRKNHSPPTSVVLAYVPASGGIFALEGDLLQSL